MKSKKHVIYIPGLGDSRSRGQDKAIKLLKLWGVTPHYFSFGWAKSDDFELKLKELLAKIDKLTENGHKVSLVAASAGASAAINAFAVRKDKISSVVLICGKVNNLNRINNSFYRANPNFKSSVNTLPESLENLSLADRKKILSLRPSVDPLVPPKDTIIEGATNKQLKIAGHSTTIAYCLTFGIFRIAKWIRKSN